ncbi:MAG: sulfate transporter [Planctomycetota bacterium]|nr:MAG: sulfate transporter [Planctomycetota bacterium]
MPVPIAADPPAEEDRPPRLRFDLAEASGALGDLGTFLPLVVALATVGGLDLGAILFFAGICNILSGLAFGQPIPVQPMKAIAAVAIAEALAPAEIAAAGLAAGAVVFLLGATGLVEVVERRVPAAVVRGIQLGVGLKLFVAGIQQIGPLGPELEGPLLAAGGAALVLLTGRWPRFPAALLLFLAGFLVLALRRPELYGHLALGWSGPSLVVPDAAAWREGILRGTLPQLPLTLLNSVIAVCALSEDLFPRRGIGTRPMALSVGLMNLGCCWFGAMPMCHGSGGLAGQYRFGARTGGSVVLLGLAKVLVAVLFGSSAMALLAAYPAAILGLMLCFAGVELAAPARKAATPDGFLVVIVTAGGCLGFDTAVGFLLGLAVALGLGLRDRLRCA